MGFMEQICVVSGCLLHFVNINSTVGLVWFSQ